MSVELDLQLEQTGTRFRIFPQPRYLPAFSQPEVVTVSVPVGEVRPGPADTRMFVVDAANKLPYSQANRPPFKGKANPPVQPGPDGHFDHLDPKSRAFQAATMYATVRRVLDIWEDYFGGHIAWHFEAHFDRLELIPLIEWDNAQSGYGFLEFGYGRKAGGGIDHSRPYCENFDVLAHELGHSLIFAEVGYPKFANDPALDYSGMHESAGDLVAIVASLHFNSVVDHVLASTSGNLFSVNELERVGELSESREIRTAFNYHRMSDVGAEPHERSLPLTGAIFDVMVEMFQIKLVQRGLITADLAKRSSQEPDNTVQDLAALQAEFAAAYAGHETGFKAALLEARDGLGRLLAECWRNLSPDFLTYHEVLRQLLRADRKLNQGAFQETIRSCFAWREISLAPDSLLLRSHTLADCGMDSGPRPLAELEAGAIVGMIEVLEDELSRRKERPARLPGGRIPEPAE
ncbi:hypothetical protein [Phenylobacterium sp.]|uniref:hypothetical protein n=1 Tax=Phenylobacterium sp. TaxID=1871053 RepID=UPI002D179E8C|nr:hypothetical protein [Phenylobacterium sp.]HVI33092.1 hypothetical protein [Phenylobacterium sp.]